MPPVASPATRSWMKSAIECSALVLRSERSERLEGRPHALSLPPSFETAATRPPQDEAVAGSFPSLPASLPQLRQFAGDLLFTVHHLGNVADAVDVAFVVPGGFEQDARLVLRRDGHAMQRLRQRLGVELAELGGRVSHRIDAGVALDAVVIRHI